MTPQSERSLASAPNPLAGRVAVVTGGSSGIGRAIATALAAHGAKVCAVGRNMGALEETVAASPAASPVRPYQADLTSDEEMAGLRDWLAREFGCVDLLVHCAGVIREALLSDALIDDFDLQYQSNVRGPYLLTQLLLPMLRAAQGQIVFVNSSVGLNARRSGIGHYAATHHAMKAVADSLREEVNRDGVRILLVHPGRTATPLQEELYRLKGKPYDATQLLQPEDVAQAILGAITLPRTAEVTDISIRPMTKPS
jgi:NAD(P)-dependent dehydrogenase (short-subunit alcohol dehydrogenase family)